MVNRYGIAGGVGLDKDWFTMMTHMGDVTGR
jgi:hypothetical protein